jgi:hypothetical protein
MPKYTVKAAVVIRVKSVMNLNKFKHKSIPKNNSKPIISLANKIDKSKENKLIVNIYNSKSSIVRSFKIAEAIKIKPKKILTISFHIKK